MNLTPAWRLLYNGANISGEIASEVSEVRWCERIGGQAAEASFTVTDGGRKWQSSTYPTLTDLLQLSIGYAGSPLHDCGTFTVDEFALTTPPDKMEVKCIQAWMTLPIRTPRAQLYGNLNMQGIASLIAQKYGWSLVYSAGTFLDTPWTCKVQKYQDGGDLGFLQRLADENDFEVNIRPPQLIFYHRSALEAQEPTGPELVRTQIKRASFRWQSVADLTQIGAAGSYPDPVTKNTFSAQVSAASGSDTSANTLNFCKRVENAQQCANLAASALHQQNMLMYQADIELPGTTAYLSGQTVSLPASNWGIFSGTWLVEESEHTLRPSAGYMTKLIMRTAGPGASLVPGRSSA